MAKPPKNKTTEPFKKRGGTTFPRVDLGKAEKYARALASKTHTGAQDVAIIMTGVFDAGGSRGAIRLSACRQFGLVAGVNKAIEASEPARELSAADGEGRIRLLQAAFLTPPLFKKLHTAFQGDQRSIAELRQQAQKFRVHPDNLEECVAVFTASGIHAGLISQVGDRYAIRQVGSLAQPESSPEESADVVDEELQEEAENGSGMDLSEEEQAPEAGMSGAQEVTRRFRRGGASITIDLKIDSSMDADKLAKMVRILKQNGLI